jgi:hypothetical protein
MFNKKTKKDPEKSHFGFMIASHGSVCLVTLCDLMVCKCFTTKIPLGRGRRRNIWINVFLDSISFQPFHWV